MSVAIVVPQMGESVTEGVIAKWLKAEGEPVAADEPVVEVETDKITVEVPAPRAGVLTKQTASQGSTVSVGDVIGQIDERASANDGPKAAPTPSKVATPTSSNGNQASAKPSSPSTSSPASSAAATNGSAATSPAASRTHEAAADRSDAARDVAAGPAARQEASRLGVDLTQVDGSGRGGRIIKSDVLRTAERGTPATTARSHAPGSGAARGREERKPMTPLRRRVAERLVKAQAEAAILTTFNEVDMSAVMSLRQRYKESFVQRHGVKLGFMSFFIKASIEALREFPAVNAEIAGDDVIYKHYYDIGVAVGGGKGLVVPVLRDADQKGFATLEREIADLGERAKANKLTLEDLSGGTFTISNGGVYGSMLSTPILNPPQTGILGLHNIVERPVALAGKVEIRPVMYLALSYDHRLVDGREAVQFLVRVKQCIEDPERLLLEV